MAYNLLDSSFTWGETVKVKMNSPKEFRPGELCFVCGIWNIQNETVSKEFHQPIGTRMYTIEFADGYDIQIPEYFLEKP